MKVATKIHSYDPDTERYLLSLDTNKHLGSRWASLSTTELGDAMTRSPPLFLPNSLLPTFPPHPAGG
eukprot:1412378-Rhodomonas_salina.1